MIFKNIPYFIILLFLVWIFYSNVKGPESINESICDIQGEFLSEEINATVVSVYKDSIHHNIPTIIITQSNKQRKLDLAFENSNLFLKLDSGDSLIKKSGSLLYKVIKKNEIIADTLSFNCN